MEFDEFGAVPNSEPELDEVFDPGGGLNEKAEGAFGTEKMD